MLHILSITVKPIMYGFIHYISCHQKHQQEILSSAKYSEAYTESSLSSA